MLLKVLQNLRESTCDGAFFSQSAGLDLQIYHKKTLSQVFSIEIFQNIYPMQTSRGLFL